MQYYVIAHHGILNMKWGQRNGPPYPLSPSQHSAAEKRAMKKQARAERRERRKIKKSERKAKRAAKKQAAWEKEKERVLSSGGPDEVLKYRGRLSNQELERAYKRIDWEQKIEAQALQKKKNKSAYTAMDNAKTKMEKTRNFGQEGINWYNTIAKVRNAFTDKDPWPIIGEKKNKNKDKKKEKKSDDSNDSSGKEPKYNNDDYVDAEFTEWDEYQKRRTSLVPYRKSRW